MHKKVWKTIEIGIYKDSMALRKALKESRVLINDWVGGILSGMELSKTKESIDLVVLSVDELGFPKGALYQDILKAAKKEGLELCPAEVGPQLRLQYLDQPKDEWLLIAMEPIKDSAGDLALLHLKHRIDGFWLFTFYAYPDRVCDDFYRFVFVRRR